MGTHKLSYEDVKLNAEVWRSLYLSGRKDIERSDALHTSVFILLGIIHTGDCSLLPNDIRTVDDMVNMVQDMNATDEVTGEPSDDD